MRTLLGDEKVIESFRFLSDQFHPHPMSGRTGESGLESVEMQKLKVGFFRVSRDYGIAHESEIHFAQKSRLFSALNSVKGDVLTRMSS